jgi:recombination protein RecA
MSQALRKLAGAINKSNTAAIFINQLREKVGVMYGNPETTPGGRALKFYSSVRIDVRKTEQLKNSGEMVGNKTRCKVVKNKVAPPFKQAEFEIIYGKGISKAGEVLDIGVDLDIIEKSGSFFSYNGERIAQGRDNARKYLEEHKDMMKEIEDKIKAKADDVELDTGTFELDDDESDDDAYILNTAALDINADDE